MSKLEVNAVEPQCGTNLTLGASGDTIIIPSGATISNQGTAAGFGPTGAVSWDTTKKTTGFTAVSGVGYFCDTTSSAFTVTLPSTPSAGAVVGICDYANTFATNNLTVGRNSSNIGGVAANGKLNVDGVSVTFVYVDATQGWIVTDSGQRSNLNTAQFVAATGGTVTCCGDYKIHTFTGPGTFTVTCAGNSQGSNSVDYLVIAGGGGTESNGGGGGGGGFRLSNSLGLPAPTTSPLASPTGLPVSAQGYPITVGGGGTAGTIQGGPRASTPGSNSIFSTITSAGGGASSSPNNTPTINDGFAGGSGGGTRGGNVAGAGNTPPVNPPQGNPGGVSPNASTFGSGGGAGAAGTGNNPQIGGDGSYVSPSFAGANGTTGPVPGVRYFSGGGGGASQSQPCSSSTKAGGAGGGGTGAAQDVTNNTPGTINTGGGGGSGNGGPTSGSAGGSGIVVIRYKFQ